MWGQKITSADWVLPGSDVCKGDTRFFCGGTKIEHYSEKNLHIPKTGGIGGGVGVNAVTRGKKK